MRKFLESLARVAKNITREVAGIAGFLLIAIGAGMVSLPLGFIVAGALLVCGAVVAPKADD